MENKWRPYEIVFENEYFIVVNKSYGVLSVPPRDKEDKRPVLGQILEIDLGMQIYPVHRLDFEVQGLIMYAKTTQAHKESNGWFLNRLINKTYAAISSPLQNGDAEEFKVGEEYVWTCKLLKGKKRAFISPHGKHSETKAKLIRVEANRFFWQLSPVTGRSHQLRFELFRHGHPILGDKLYSSPVTFLENRIALCSLRLEFSSETSFKTFGLPPYLEILPFL